MTAPEPVCGYVEDVADGSMCMCGIPALTHDAVMAAREKAPEQTRPRPPSWTNAPPSPHEPRTTQHHQPQGDAP